MSERSSWMSKEAKVNGLFAAHLPMGRSKKSNRVMPVSHTTENEVAALRKIENEEAKIKDKMLEELGARCSQVEAKLEEVLMEKARVERELASSKYAAQIEGDRQRQLEDTSKQLGTAQSRCRELEEKIQVLEMQVINVSKQLHDARQQSEKRVRELQQAMESKDHAMTQMLAEVDRSKKAFVEQLAASERNRQALNGREIDKVQQQNIALAQQNAALAEANAELCQRLASLSAEKDQLAQTNMQLADRLESGEAQVENSRKRNEGQAIRLRDQDRLIRESEERFKESEGKAERMADQLRASNKRAAYLAKKAEQADEKLVAKNQETLALKEKLGELARKYQQAKERLDYYKLTAGQAANCAVPRTSSNNEHEDDPAAGTGQSLPGVKLMQRTFIQAPKAVADTQASRKGDRVEDQGRVQRKRASEAMPDPARAVDSSAPEWMKF